MNKTSSVSKKYNNTKLAISIFKSVTSFLLIIFFIYSGLNLVLKDFLLSFIKNDLLLFISYLFSIGLISSIIYFPLTFYSEYILEHKYNLSNQTLLKYFWEDIKGLLVGLVIGTPILIAFYYTLLNFPVYWWLVFATILFFFSVVLARIVPVVILPLFYKVEPLSDEDLKERIVRLAERAKLKVENVFSFNMSKNTKKANAAFTGLGKSKRILLGDTLLDSFDKDEIETVIAHELGHYKHKHITKNIILGTLSSYLTLYILSVLYTNTFHFAGTKSIIDPASLPVLFIWSSIIGFIQTPLMNMLSRKYEYEADTYAVNETKKGDVFINALNKLSDQNLADENPNKLVEWYSYSHPSIKRRVAFINNLQGKE